MDVDFKIKKDKSILLMWSGGYDSTLILIEALRQGYNIRTLYVDLQNNKIKSLREIYKRHIIKEKLENKFSKVIEDKVVKFSLLSKEKKMGLSQPYLWLTCVLPHVKNDDDYLCLGYLETSVFWHISSYWKEALISLQKCIFIYDTNYIKPLFPLEWITKYKCHKYFEKYYPKIYKLCHTCENPKVKKGRIVDCGECLPCKNLIEVKEKRGKK